MQQRRKSASAAAPAASKQAPARRAGAPLSLAGVVVSIFLVATFLYNEDVVKHTTELPLAARARSHDLRVLQEAAHHKVNSRQASSTHDAEEEVGIRSKEKNKGKEEEQAQQVVRLQILDAPISSLRVGAGERADKQAAGGKVSSSGQIAAARLAEPGSCDVYKGWWVYDAEGEQAPLYREAACEFLTEQVTCMRNGRRDDSYQKWRWQPAGCDLPRFDARLLLERLRGKRLMFVGDSLNRNQWESMVCLVQSVIPPGQKTLTKNGSLNVFRAHEYNATVEFYWAPFLVQSNSDDPQVHSVRDRIIAWRSISKHARNWKGVHYLIFNTYIWWLNTFDIKVLKGGGSSFERAKYALVDRPIAYRGVLKTWAKWVDRHIHPNKTMVFFMALSPNHVTPEAWGNAGAIKCAMETQPVLNQTAPLYIGTDWRLHGVAQGVLRSMRRVPVHLVDITALSELRKDAHTSVHTLRQGKLLTPEQQADPRTYADCIHWCLPGLPDTWNHFLFAQIAAAASSRPLFPGGSSSASAT